MAINCANDGITIVDMKSLGQPLIFINKAFEKMTGYMKSEAIGQNCRFLQGNLKQPKELKIIRDAIKNNKSCRVTLKNFTKHGELFWNELSLAPIKNKDGEVDYYVGIQKDVTNETQIFQKEIYRLHEENVQLNQQLESVLNQFMICKSDMYHIFNNIKVPILYLNKDLQIYRYNAQFEKILKLIPQDVGRSISDFNVQFDGVNLADYIKEVLVGNTAKTLRVRHQNIIYILYITPITECQSFQNGVAICLIEFS